MNTNRRQSLLGLGMAVAATAGLARSAQASPEAPLAAKGAKTLEALHGHLAKAPRRRDYNSVPMILDNRDQWDAEALKEIANHCSTPIALGERLFSRWDFKHILAGGYVDIIQPDPSHAGGITETRKIAAMAEAYDVALALHCPLGPIALAANLQLDAVCYNAFIQEQSLGIHYNAGSDLLDYLKDPSVFAYKDGFVAIPQGPGLGIEVDEDVVRRRAAEGHRWRNPIWRHEDGSFAEW